MKNEKTIVVTTYGHDETIDKIAVSLFNYSLFNSVSTDAETYCRTINGLELKDNKWINARVINEHQQYRFDMFIPFNFSNLIMKLKDRDIQKVLRETDNYDVANSLDGEDEIIKEKIFSNMSKRAVQIIKEDMKCLGPVRIRNVKESQEKIVNLIKTLSEFKEINLEGETE